MATNLYFNNYNSSPEQRLVEDLMIETIKINGIDCYYIPNINEEKRDLLYGEDPLKKFTGAYPVEMYVVNVDGYDGEREFFSKFGLEIRNNMTVIVSKRSFARWVPQTYIRPREGDLIYVPFLSQNGEMYEIRYVNYSDSFYVLGNKYPYFYKLELEKFKYSQETIDVGIPEIDDLVPQEAYQIELNVNTATGNGNFEIGESVHNSANSVYGTVTTWDKPTGILKVTDIYGTFANNMLLRGNTSNASYTTSASPDELKDNLEREEYDNKLIQTEANTIIDFSESNPFGSIT
jgi:hypothetical protein